MNAPYDLIEKNLLLVTDEISIQTSVIECFPLGKAQFEKLFEEIYNFITVGGEYGLAYEYLVGALEMFPFTLTSRACIKLLEVALIMGFKTEAEEDKDFDMRER